MAWYSNSVNRCSTDLILLIFKGNHLLWEDCSKIKRKRQVRRKDGGGMPVAPTDREIIGLLILLALGVGFLAYAWIKGREEERRTVTWIRDWKEYP